METVRVVCAHDCPDMCSLLAHVDNGRVVRIEVASGLGAAVQGSPLNSVAWLANTLGRLGLPFRAGEIILSGALGPMIEITAGDTFLLSLSDGLGTCRLNFE